MAGIVESFVCNIYLCRQQHLSYKFSQTIRWHVGSRNHQHMFDNSRIKISLNKFIIFANGKCIEPGFFLTTTRGAIAAVAKKGSFTYFFLPSWIKYKVHLLKFGHFDLQKGGYPEYQLTTCDWVTSKWLHLSFIQSLKVQSGLLLFIEVLDSVRQKASRVYFFFNLSPAFMQFAGKTLRDHTGL